MFSVFSSAAAVVQTVEDAEQEGSGREDVHGEGEAAPWLQTPFKSSESLERASQPHSKKQGCDFIKVKLVKPHCILWVLNILIFHR